MNNPPHTSLIVSYESQEEAAAKQQAEVAAARATSPKTGTVPSGVMATTHQSSPQRVKKRVGARKSMVMANTGLQYDTMELQQRVRTHLYFNGNRGGTIERLGSTAPLKAP